MVWLRNTDKEARTVKYTVLYGYQYREGLAKLGFEFNGRDRTWEIIVQRSQKAEIEEIEGFLNTAERLDRTANKLKYATKPTVSFWQ